MATTSRPWDLLVAGFRDITGAPVASGKVRWYNPGTLVAAVAYADAACASPATAPLTLNAQGQGGLYFLEPVRVVVKDSTETLTFYDDIAPLNRHDSLYITHPNVNAGVETTLETFITTLTGSIGTNFSYLESAGATGRSYTTWLGELLVSVKDFGAVGDGSADDTAAVQAACDRVEARGGGWVFFPKGTYKISAGITIDTAGVSICGAGRSVAVIKNASTSGNALSVNLGSALDSKITIKDISITASTVSSGKAVVFANGNRPLIQNVAVALHRTGIDVSAVTEPTVARCIVESTDDNAAAVGITLGTRGHGNECIVISGTVNGTGITTGSDARATDCYVEKFVTGVSLGAVNGQARSCTVSGATTGYLVGSTACAVVFCKATGCTNDLTAPLIRTDFVEHGNDFATFSGAGNYSPLPRPTAFRAAVNLLLDTVSTTPSITPTIVAGKSWNVQRIINASATALTVNAPTGVGGATTNFAHGDLLVLTIAKDGANAVTITWNAAFFDIDGTAVSTVSVSGDTANSFWFFYDSAVSISGGVPRWVLLDCRAPAAAWSI
jgi:Pectate lyase superfamily protein